MRKRGVVLEKGISFKTNNGFYEKFDNLIPFSLTSAQRRVIDEIKGDMAKPHPMHRLIQGDVGSGKTIVAFAATLIAVENNYQAAIMAPTELLAEQHYLTLHQLAKQVGLRTTLLVSGIKSSLRKDIYKNIKFTSLRNFSTF